MAIVDEWSVFSSSVGSTYSYSFGVVVNVQYIAWLVLFAFIYSNQLYNVFFSLSARPFRIIPERVFFCARSFGYFIAYFIYKTNCIIINKTELFSCFFRLHKRKEYMHLFMCVCEFVCVCVRRTNTHISIHSQLNRAASKNVVFFSTNECYLLMISKKGIIIGSINVNDIKWKPPKKT